MLTALDIEVILAFVDCNMKAASAAKQIYVHRNTVEYRLAKIRKETGLNPKVFRDLVKLLAMVEDRLAGD